MSELQPFQLDFPIPEIGAEPGDWIDIDLHSRPPGLVLMRRIPRERVALLRRHWDRLDQFLSRLPDRPTDPMPPVGGRRLEVVRG